MIMSKRKVANVLAAESVASAREKSIVASRVVETSHIITSLPGNVLGMAILSLAIGSSS